MKKRKTEIDRAIEASEARIKLEQEVLARLQQAKKDAPVRVRKPKTEPAS